MIPLHLSFIMLWFVLCDKNRQFSQIQLPCLAFIHIICATLIWLLLATKSIKKIWCKVETRKMLLHCKGHGSFIHSLVSENHLSYFYSTSPHCLTKSLHFLPPSGSLSLVSLLNSKIAFSRWERRGRGRKEGSTSH